MPQLDAPIFDRAAHGVSYPEPFFLEWPRMRAARHLYRWVLGRPMNGRIYTDCTFFRDATSGYPSRWLRLAGWKRAAVRTLVPYVIMLALMIWAFTLLHALAAVRLLIEVNGAAIVITGAPILLTRVIAARGLHVRVLVRGVIDIPSAIDEHGEACDWEERRVFEWRTITLIEGRREWERTTVLPLARVLVSKWALPNAQAFPRAARRWITVPRDYMNPGGGSVVIRIPARIIPSEKDMTTYERAIAAKLGMLEWSARWELAGDQPRLLMRSPIAPPKRITYTEVRDLLAATQEYRPFLGVVADELAERMWSLLSAEMIDDSPHIALSAGSGAGKSMLIKAIIMQAMRWGWFVIVLDWKSSSHTWAKGMDGVRYVTSVEGIHDTLVEIGDEVDRRKDDEVGTPRVLVVREEWNMTSDLLAEYWSQLRSMAEPDEKRAMPVRSPALTGAKKLDYAGRQFGLFDLLAAQRMSNRVFNGNTDLRENFMIRLLARYTTQTWKMLVPHIKYIRKPKEIGRWVVAAGDDATVIQGILISDDEAREFATGGAPAPASPWATVYRPSMTRTQGDQLGPDLTGPSSPVLRKLSDIALVVEDLDISLNMLQLAAKRDPEFPPAIGGNQFRGYLYDQGEVRRWAVRKRAAERAELEAK